MAGLINFEDEKEVKQYLDNIGVEFSYQCYRQKNPEGVKKNVEATTQVLKHNCGMNKHGEVAENLKMAYS
ncbi:unnamed protein product [Coregonus sp. 'balchen']|nr:unnamed protein product [Coregonus sp. 'balchen']